MAILLLVIVALIEYFWSWNKDLVSMGRENPASANVVTAVGWPPSVSGAFIGLLQVPLVLVVKDTVGGSSSYVTIVSQWVITDKLAQTFPYLAKRRSGVGNWWQVFFVSFVVVGACLSGVSSDTLNTSKGPQLPMALFGGFLLLFGARLGAGCTSGHGLSGMALLAWLSFIAVPAMFAGGISTAFAMQATGALDNYIDHTGAVL
ncbi:probable transporter PD_1892 [Argopecten irradians]|uniref:probable transporter PD_1892 n=1 Tax=Argopecten irradians TaxID=31199 RepID=UPI003722CB1C